MNLAVSEAFCLVLAALAGGMFWGPWLALTYSIDTFEPAVLLAICDRLNRNMAAVMTWLLPAALLGTGPVLWLAWGRHPTTFYLTLAGAGCYLLALAVTMAVEVPIVKQIVGWRADALPANWQALRDRWAAFHVVRVVAAVAGLVCLVAGALAG